jgi:hypothetical protein
VAGNAVTRQSRQEGDVGDLHLETMSLG